MESAFTRHTHHSLEPGDLGPRSIATLGGGGGFEPV